ncbi:hypothetical protein PPERSA_09837 [Pseudocohnilembus persalinus]|uniref:Uncharacterized protein n=1 Tax=Pseudocohnilembus persalinus TaxID=266149 RepID=A0A0V0QU13_PSEPJ|nr:hypothetical protein PPERSA_09837 [Pseudocohnilembus persalinus]|eukprot:KRX05697.1 hypothetical protein PPERSA_09837 [Pseudocohnilembus persalinus]
MQQMKQLEEFNNPNYTYQPVTNKKKNTSLSPYSQVQRSYDFLKVKREKIENLKNLTQLEKQKEIEKNCTFKPNICSINPDKIIKNEPNTNPYIRKGYEQFYERQDKAKRMQQEKQHKLNSIGKSKNCKWNNQITKSQEFNLTKPKFKIYKGINDQQDVNIYAPLKPFQEANNTLSLFLSSFNSKKNYNQNKNE